VISALRFKDPEREVEVKIEPDIEVEGDSGLLRVAIENLLSNAWKYTSKTERPVIAFGIISEPSRRICFVRDKGVGFEIKYADRLFAPFQRMHDVVRIVGGTALMPVS
jgi:light-regulated signal transduction histidine kinase (bacteriophytochrome)